MCITRVVLGMSTHMLNMTRHTHLASISHALVFDCVQCTWISPIAWSLCNHRDMLTSDIVAIMSHPLGNDMMGWCITVASDVGQTHAPACMSQPMLNVTSCMHIITASQAMSSPGPVDVSNTYVCKQCMHHVYVCPYMQAEFSHVAFCYQCPITYVQWS